MNSNDAPRQRRWNPVPLPRHISLPLCNPVVARCARDHRLLADAALRHERGGQ
jgi:hypothetical protein